MKPQQMLIKRVLGLTNADINGAFIITRAGKVVPDDTVVKDENGKVISVTPNALETLPSNEPIKINPIG